MAAATVLALDKLSHQHAGDKVRIVARTVAYDPQQHMLLVAHGSHALLADVSLCLNPKQHALFLRPKAIVMLMGRVEHSEVALTLPDAQAPPLHVDEHLVLRAILARHVDDADLDLSTWAMAIPARNSSVASFASTTQTR